MNKKIKCLITSFAVLFTTLTSCNTKQNPDEVLLNGFETINDLYNVRQLMSNISYAVRAKLELNSNEKYIKSGEGSLKVTHTTNECSYIFQRIDTTSALDGLDISDIAKLSLWVYNDNEFELPVSLNIVGQEQTVLTSYSKNIPAKEWSLVTFNINKVVISYNYKTIQGFSIGFNRTSPITCYIDDFYLSFGSEYSEEDNKYMSAVESLNQRMGAIPESISVSDAASIEEARQIGLAYQNIPEIYKVACTNYTRYQSALSSYVQAYSLDHVLDSSVTNFFFGSIFGLSQVSLGSRTQTFPLSYSEDKKYAGENGTLKAEITDDTLDWWCFDAASPFQPQSYKTLELNVFPDTDHDLSLSVSWDTSHLLKAKEWNKVTVSTARFVEGTTSTLEFEFTGLNNLGESVGFLGNVYFSSAILIRNSAQDFANLVNTLLPIEDLTYDDRFTVESVFDFYYNLDINEQSKPLAMEAFLILLAAHEKVISEGKKLLPGKIAALPEIANFKVYHYEFVEECMAIYDTMSESEKESLTERKKLLDLNAFANNNYGLVFTPGSNLLNFRDFAGESDAVEIVHDKNYGTLFHATSTDCKYGMAFNLSYGDLDEYSEIRFFVSSKNLTRFGLFAATWWSDAYDFSRGIVIPDLLGTQFIIDNDVFYECVIPVDDFMRMNYFMFNSFFDGATIDIDAKITSFYGVKK